jgi:hypothetical protein
MNRSLSNGSSAVLFPPYIHLLSIFLCDCSSLYPQFATSSSTASSFTAALLTYAQYFLDKAQLLLPKTQPGSIHLAWGHVVHPQHIKRRAGPLFRPKITSSD